MIETEVTIINKLGLHARAAAKFVSTASAYDCKVELGRDGRMVDGKSIMGVMMLAASQGTTLRMRLDGPQEQEAHTGLLALINDYFGEGE